MYRAARAEPLLGERAVHSGPLMRTSPWAVSLATAVLFVTLALVSRAVADENEQRLLEQQTAQAGQALAITIEQLRTPLESVATTVSVVGDDPLAFDRLARSLLVPAAGYDRAALFRLDEGEPTSVIGDPLVIGNHPEQLADLLRRAPTNSFLIVDLLHDERTLGYAVVDDPSNPSHVVYAERTLSADPNVRRQFGGAFLTIDYALYLGTEERADSLLGASVRDLPFTGRRADRSIPFGDTELLLVTEPSVRLGSELLGSLWWIVLIGGGVASLATGLLLTKLGRSRERAVDLASEIQTLYRREHDVAETLQLALLPSSVDPPPGCEVTTRYWPADVTKLVGGDFYDVFGTDDGSWFVVIGDVCGHGIDAAAVTGIVRHTLRGAAQNARSPSEMLLTAHRALVSQRDHTFCTVCLVVFRPDSVGGGRAVVSLGGHPPPVLRRRSGEVETVGRTGMLLGVLDPVLHDTTLEVEQGDTLVLYTDGLTDAPGGRGLSFDEVVTMVGASGERSIGDMADTIRAGQRDRQPGGSDDDTALVIIRFGAAPATPVAPEVVLTATQS